MAGQFYTLLFLAVYFASLIIYALYIGEKYRTQAAKAVISVVAKLFGIEVYYNRYYAPFMPIEQPLVIKQSSLTRVHVDRNFQYPDDDLFRLRHWADSRDRNEAQLYEFAARAGNAVKELLLNRPDLIERRRFENDPLNRYPQEYYLFEFWIDENK